MKYVVVDAKFGFVLDDEMYDLARAALAEIAPDEVPRFTAERFFARENWRLIPDVEHPNDEMPWYKAEFIVKQGPPWLQTIKLNVWLKPDLRRDGAPMPHNHPWPFISRILRGGYKEIRYEVHSWRSRNRILLDPHSCWKVGSVTEALKARVAGGENDMPLSVFHEVTEIFEPGTFTIMNCDLGRKEGWGHLEVNSKGELVYVPNKLNPDMDGRFRKMMRYLNPK